MPLLSREPDRSTELTAIELASVVHQQRTYSARAFGEPRPGGEHAAWLQFRLDAPGWPTVSTERRLVTSRAALAKWARGLDRSRLRARLDAALTRWKRSDPFEPTLVKTTAPVTDGTGALYDARVFCEEDGHLWVAWLEFEPQAGGPTWVTGHETSQPTQGAVGYWVQGLEALYFQGALDRARWWSSVTGSDRDRRVTA